MNLANDLFDISRRIEQLEALFGVLILEGSQRGINQICALSDLGKDACSALLTDIDALGETTREIGVRQQRRY